MRSMAVPQEWLLIAVVEPRTSRAHNMPAVPSTECTSLRSPRISAKMRSSASTAGFKPDTRKGPTLRVSSSA